LNSPLANHLKFINKVKDLKRKAEIDFLLYHFFRSGDYAPVYFS
jgi:hypothetical protein